ncbi:MAG TPA: universal stress protein [Syntrophobacteraceae bacterium]|nr:universal stress protein [Syntrophobacteraceae bacterium]
MFKHILIPTDLTDKSLRALEIAAKIAVHDQARLTLLHVIETIEDAFEGELDDFYRKLGRRAHKKMDQFLKLHETKEIRIDKEIIYGKRVKEIIRFAGDRDIDLIILSSHKVEIDNPGLGWGTISYKVGILAHCPVMLVK